MLKSPLNDRACENRRKNKERSRKCLAEEFRDTNGKCAKTYEDTLRSTLTIENVQL